MIIVTTVLNALHLDITRMASLAAAQFDAAIECLRGEHLDQVEEIIERDDVVDNLNMSIEERCFDLAATGQCSEHELRTLRATLKVAINLERCGDAATHIAKRVRIMRQEEATRVGPFEFDQILDLAALSLQDASRAFLDRDLLLAQRACEREPELDALYVPKILELRDRLQLAPDEVPYLLHCLSVMKYCEKVTDYVLNIGEQTIFLITGRRLKFAQFQQLDRLIGNQEPTALGFRPFWDGLSGALVARIEGGERPVLYKEGSRRKIQQEADKFREWERIGEDLTPRIIGSVNLRDRQALLRDFANGMLLSDLYMSEVETATKLTATRRLLAVVDMVWRSTLQPIPPVVDSVEQMRRRLPDVYALHPNLRQVGQVGTITGGRATSLDALLDAAHDLQSKLAPRFSVWLHGDFNANNVVYDQSADQIKFVDVHRSQHGDYLQDVSIFLVSMMRRTDLSEEARHDIAGVNALVADFARDFALEHGDDGFDDRLLISLARAHLTSARVVVEPAQAEALFRTGMELLAEVARPT